MPSHHPIYHSWIYYSYFQGSTVIQYINLSFSRPHQRAALIYYNSPTSLFLNQLLSLYNMSVRYHNTSSRPQPQTTSVNYSRSSTSSDSSMSSSSSASSSYSNSPYLQPRVEVMRCSRCAKTVETISSYSPAANPNDQLSRITTDDASANGMVRFGHNLYYCDRCARMVGYK